jgi:hypothetical protein
VHAITDLYDAVVEALQKDKIGRVRIGRGVCENENPIFLQCQPWPAVDRGGGVFSPDNTMSVAAILATPTF